MLGAIATTLLVLVPLGSQPVGAQETSTDSTPNTLPIVQATPLAKSLIPFNAPPPPADQGAPGGRRDGGASRGNCEQYDNLTALVPLTDGVVWGQTTATHPTLWIYSPAAIQQNTPLEFVVQDGDDEMLDYATAQVDVESGIYSYSLPETAPALSLNEPYYWTIAIYCDPAHPASFVYVRGTVQRVAVDSLDASGLEIFSPEIFSSEIFSSETERSLSQAQRYAEAGVWHDALTILAELRQTSPTDPDIETTWVELLQQIGLEAIAPAPIQNCCSPQR